MKDANELECDKFKKLNFLMQMSYLVIEYIDDISTKIFAAVNQMPNYMRVFLKMID
jgi:hypothetical protein